jgi:hypothetical protein
MHDMPNRSFVCIIEAGLKVTIPDVADIQKVSHGEELMSLYADTFVASFVAMYKNIKALDETKVEELISHVPWVGKTKDGIPDEVFNFCVCLSNGNFKTQVGSASGLEDRQEEQKCCSVKKWFT